MNKDSREANQRRFPSRKGRTLTVSGKQWKIVIGSSAINAYCEDGRHAIGTPRGVKGCDPDTFDRGQWKRTSDGAVLPSELAAWLDEQPV